MYCVWGKELEVISPSLFTWSLFIELNGETCEVTSLPLGSSLSRGYFCSFRQTGPITFEVCNAVGPSSTRMPLGLRREATPDRVRSGFAGLLHLGEVGIWTSSEVALGPRSGLDPPMCRVSPR